MSVILSHTTPINYLVLIDQIAVLHHLYGRVIIPQAVFGELQQEGTPAKVKAWVASHPDWLEVRPVSAALDAALAFLDVVNAKRLAWPKSWRPMPSSSTNQRVARQRNDTDAG